MEAHLEKLNITSQEYNKPNIPINRMKHLKDQIRKPKDLPNFQSDIILKDDPEQLETWRTSANDIATGPANWPK